MYKARIETMRHGGSGQFELLDEVFLPQLPARGDVINLPWRDEGQRSFQVRLVSQVVARADGPVPEMFEALIWVDDRQQMIEEAARGR